MITIDGSEGEGGGQILRTALALSIVTGQAFRIVNIRAKRERGGLMRQHLTAVNAAAAISDAEVTGAGIGSRALTFVPGKVRGGDYTFSVGSAGSTTLVFQTVLPALLQADRPSTLAFEGGTHNFGGPPFEFIDRAFLPLLRRMGVTAEASLERHGFYPVGGGRFTVTLSPVKSLARLDLPSRGAETSRMAHALIANLPRDIADRELKEVGIRLGLSTDALHLQGAERSPGPGNVLLVTLAFEQVTEVFAGYGKVGVRAEHVAERTAANALRYLAVDAAAGPHLADQLLIPMALAGGGHFTTLRPSLHTRTNADIIRRFLDVDIAIAPATEKAWEVTVG